MPYRHSRQKAGFTLAELLISLAILGVIATFTIPKVLQSQQDERKEAAAKEVIAAIGEAYQKYKAEGKDPSTLSPKTLGRNYLNYAGAVTTPIDESPWGAGPLDCTGGYNQFCVRLHNGGVLYMEDNPHDFFGTENRDYIGFRFDPDGVADGGKAVHILLYYDGRVTSQGYCMPNSRAYDGTVYVSCSTSLDPTWFSWN